MTRRPREWWRAWWVVVPVALAAAVSYPITYNYFFGDDLLSVYEVINKPLVELLLVPYGGHLYIVRNALFVLLYRLFGPDPHAYYWVAFITHLVNVALLALLLRALAASDRLACFGAALWGTAPVTEGTIGWYSVYGHALATAALLLVLVGVVRAGQRGSVAAAELTLWAMLVFVGSTSFGVGLAFAVLLPLIAWLLLPPGAVRRRAVWLLSATAVAVPVLYLAARRIAASHYGSDVYGPAAVDVVKGWLGIGDLVVNMVAYAIEQIVLGPLAHFAAGWQSISATPVLLVVGATLCVAAPPTRRAMLAFAVLSIATFGIIAAGRLDLYPYFKNLLVTSQRYYYAGSLMLTVLICLALGQLGSARWPRSGARSAGLALWLVGLAGALAFERPAYEHHNWARRRAEQALGVLSGLIASVPPNADVYIENEPFYGVGPFVIAAPRNFPGLAGLFVVYYPSNVVDGHRVFFIEPDFDVRVAAIRGMRSVTLLVAPELVPAGAERRIPPPLAGSAPPHPAPSPPPEGAH